MDVLVIKLLFLGKLVLSLTGELYSQLGLQGSIESFGSIKNKKSVLQHKYRKYRLNECGIRS